MTVEGGRLMTQITGQPKFELFAESETKFFLKVVEAQVEFFTDASGAVTHLMIHQGGQETKAAKESKISVSLDKFRALNLKVSLREFRLKKHIPELHIYFGPLDCFAE